MKNIITNNIAKNYMNNIVILILILSVFCQTLRCHCLSLVCGIYTSVRQFIQFSSSQHDAEAEKIRKNKRKKKKKRLFLAYEGRRASKQGGTCLNLHINTEISERSRILCYLLR